ncbi:hypothetical protein [Kibdelosporangium phytohabitans]|uniref:hypothetical protein n=1 Tax=Kibdelosporangium phytohabitans TaxID=860235 RepID=UPI0012F849F9|nr:hypothetical protein [Kibdelosporangium phytohabitans]MBE1467056.1 hypothetical protein [Kibdelosporangium phytohabitans]
MRTVLATLVGAVLSLVPWVAGLLTPRMSTGKCEGEFFSCLFAGATLSVFDLVFAVLFPILLTVVFAPLLSWLLLRVLRVEPPGAVTVVALVLVCLSWTALRPAALSVTATIMWAVCYLVTELTISWIRARRARSGQVSGEPPPDPPSQDP